MGCGSSKSAAAVAPMPMPETWSSSNDGLQAKAKIAGTNVIRVKELSSDSSLPADSQYSSVESILKSGAETDIPPTSEHRNGSARSTDSGLGKETHADIITEQSSPELKEVADVSESHPDENLIVDGKKMKTPGPMGHRKRSRGKLPPIHPHSKHNLQNNEEEKPDELEVILQKHVKFADVLINELPASSSIVKRPVSRGGVAFDINTEDEQVVVRHNPRKPACVVKYSQQKRVSETVTHAELDEKQKAADHRRKEQEQMRLERIWAQQEKDRLVAEALAKFAAMQTGLVKCDDRATKEENEKQAPAGAKKTTGKKTHAKVAMKKPRRVVKSPGLG